MYTSFQVVIWFLKWSVEETLDYLHEHMTGVQFQYQKWTVEEIAWQISKDYVAFLHLNLSGKHEDPIKFQSRMIDK